MSSLGYGKIYTNLLPIELQAIHGVSGLSSIIYAFKVNESKSSAFAAESIHDHLDLLDGSEFPELLVQIPLGGVETQSEYSETLGWIWIFPVCSVTIGPKAGSTTAAATTGRRGTGGRTAVGRRRTGSGTVTGGRGTGTGGTPVGGGGTASRGGGTGTRTLSTSTLVAFARVGSRTRSPRRRGGRSASRWHLVLRDLVPKTLIS